MARVHLRLDTHWEFFYELNGQLSDSRVSAQRTIAPLIAGAAGNAVVFISSRTKARRSSGVIAMRLRVERDPDDWAMALLNFANTTGQTTGPFPKAGTRKEMLDADQRTYAVGSTDHYRSVELWDGVHQAESLARASQIWLVWREKLSYDGIEVAMSKREPIAIELSQIPEPDLDSLLVFPRSLKGAQAESAIPALAAESPLSKIG
jgi:hypothetical protein